MVVGSLTNRLLERQENEEVKVGMGATIYWFSDRSACTIIEVKSKCKIVIQKDKAIRLDNRGMSEEQDYRFERDENGQIYECYCRKGVWKTQDKQRVVIGKRDCYYDYSI